MSKVAIEGNASGTGTLTIAAPNTNTNRTITLPDATGTLALTGAASNKIEEGNSKVEVTDAGTGKVEVTVDNVEVADFTTDVIVFNETGANQDFRVEGDTDANLLFVDASADVVGIGNGSPNSNFKVTITGPAGAQDTAPGQQLRLNAPTTTAGHGAGIRFDATSGAKEAVANIGVVNEAAGNSGAIVFNNYAGGATLPERMRITSAGDLLVGKTTTGNEAGTRIEPNGTVSFRRSGFAAIICERKADDGELVQFLQDGAQEGSISVSGSTVSYNGGHLSRWAQLTTPKEDTPLFKGTVMSNLDEMNVYVAPTIYWTEEDELPVDEEGNPTVAVGDVKQETFVSENEQLNKVKVSDVEGDANVAGVFVNWDHDEAHDVDEINMAMTGDMIIRIGEGVTVARGDLLMSAGDGTAMPQGDDMVRSKTVAKVTSTHVTCTYDDGSYCVPCVLMAC